MTRRENKYHAKRALDKTLRALCPNSIFIDRDTPLVSILSYPWYLKYNPSTGELVETTKYINIQRI